MEPIAIEVQEAARVTSFSPFTMIEQTSAITPTLPEVVPSMNDGMLLDAICKHIKQYVFIKNSTLYRLIALWVIATYLHEEFEYMGYLFIYSPEMSSGKTTLLTHLNLLVNKSTGVTCSPTEAVLFRTAKGHTLLLDEGDGWDNARSLRRVLNSGFHRDGMVQRCESAAGSGEFTVKDFSVYGPKALAGIGKDILTETTQSRTFLIEMLRKTSTERTRRRRGKTVPGATQLKQRIETWCKENKAEVAVLYASLADETYSYLAQFTERTQDIAEPLAAILEVMLKTSPDLVSARLELTDAIAATRNESNGLSEQLQVLTALERIMGESSTLAECPTTLAELINKGNGETQVSEQTVSQTLRSFGFQQKMVRKDVGPRRCYVIEREHLKEMIARYAVAANPEVRVM